MEKTFDLIKKIDWLMLSAVFILMIISCLTIYSSTHQKFHWQYLKRQLIFFLIGLIVMFVLSLLDYRVFRHHSSLLMIFYALGLALLLLVLIFGRTIRGSRSWINFGLFNFEPTELIKLVLILIFAKYFSSRHIEMYRIRHILISGLYLALPLGLAIMQPDFGSVVILIFLWLGVMIIAGIKLRHLIILGISGALASIGGWFFIFKDYQKQRLITFLNPHQDPLGAGYNIIQSKIAIGNGGLWGRGLSQGPQVQFGFLPEPHTDFIFASFAEEWGLIGIIILLIIFYFLLWRILKACLNSSNNFARLYCLGFLLLIFSQAVINISTNLGLLPVTGIVLPFISYGGSNLVITLAGLGILQSIIIRQKLGYKQTEIGEL